MCVCVCVAVGGKREWKRCRVSIHRIVSSIHTSAGLIVLLSPISCAVGASLAVELLLTMW